jgi:hypothetical protein
MRERFHGPSEAPRQMPRETPNTITTKAVVSDMSKLLEKAVRKISTQL